MGRASFASAVQFSVEISDVRGYLFEAIGSHGAVRSLRLVVEVFQKAAQSAKLGQDTEVGFGGDSFAKASFAYE